MIDGFLQIRILGFNIQNSINVMLNECMSLLMMKQEMVFGLDQFIISPPLIDLLFLISTSAYANRKINKFEVHLDLANSQSNLHIIFYLTFKISSFLLGLPLQDPPHCVVPESRWSMKCIQLAQTLSKIKSFRWLICLQSIFCMASSFHSISFSCISMTSNCVVDSLSHKEGFVIYV